MGNPLPFLALDSTNIKIKILEENMSSTTDGEYRLRYVAFTRVKKLLSLCCIKGLKEEDVKVI